MDFGKLIGFFGAAGMLLILALAIIKNDSDFHLKDWQPLMSALIALAAATLVYHGAMSKVALDRESQLREIKRRRLALFLKLHKDISSVSTQALLCSAQINQQVRYAEASEEGTPIVVDKVRIAGDIDLNKVWDSLDLMPSELIDPVVRFDQLLNYLDDAHYGRYLVIRNEMPEGLSGTAILLEELRELCVDFELKLRSEIDKMKKD